MKKISRTGRISFTSLVSIILTALVLSALPTFTIAESDPQTGGDASIQKGTPAAPTAEAAASAPVYKVSAKANGKSHIKIKWSKVKDADGYTVYRSAKKDKLGKKIYTSKKASKRTYKDKSADVNKKYWYTVKAWEKSGGEKKTLAVIKSKRVKNALKFDSAFDVRTYAYSGGGTTASGKKAKVGRVAVDPRVIKLGTWLYIEGYGLCQAADTGGAIKGNKIDLYMNSESECIQWGVRSKTVYILK
jgi:3D (Asp-Asp-Asp) domain-containing protein